MYRTRSRAVAPPDYPRVRVSCRIGQRVSVVSAGYCHQMRGTIVQQGGRG